MKVGFLRVVESARLYGDTYVTWFDPSTGSGQAAPDLLRGATPGQFLMLRCADVLPGAEEPLTGASLADDPLLPRAMSYHRLRHGDSGLEFAILYAVSSAGLIMWMYPSRAPYAG